MDWEPLFAFLVMAGRDETPRRSDRRFRLISALPIHLHYDVPSKTLHRPFRNDHSRPYSLPSPPPPPPHPVVTTPTTMSTSRRLTEMCTVCIVSFLS